VAKLGNDSAESLLAGLAAWKGEVWQELTLPRKRVEALLKDSGIKGKAIEAAVLGALQVRDPDAEPLTDSKGNAEPDAELRDNENVPLPLVPVTFEADVTARLQTVEYRTDVSDYLDAEVLSYVPDAWVDHDKTKVGYEIPLTRHFYKYVPPRPLEEIDAEIKTLEAEIQALLREVTE
jgi:type I restriction enzyme M protein